MSFVVPPLPGEHLLTPKEVAARVGCHVSAIYGFINDGKLDPVTVADRLLIAESEAEKLLKEWPSRNRGVSARWRDYRAGRPVAVPPFRRGVANDGHYDVGQTCPHHQAVLR